MKTIYIYEINPQAGREKETIVKDNEYKCAQCLGVFEKGRSDEEALEEKNELWGDVDLSDCVVICDDCFNGLPVLTKQ